MPQSDQLQHFQGQASSVCRTCKKKVVNAWLLAQGSYKRQNALLFYSSTVVTSQAAAILVCTQNKHVSWHTFVGLRQPV